MNVSCRGSSSKVGAVKDVQVVLAPAGVVITVLLSIQLQRLPPDHAGLFPLAQREIRVPENVLVGNGPLINNQTSGAVAYFLRRKRQLPVFLDRLRQHDGQLDAGLVRHRLPGLTRPPGPCHQTTITIAPPERRISRPRRKPHLPRDQPGQPLTKQQDS